MKKIVLFLLFLTACSPTESHDVQQERAKVVYEVQNCINGTLQYAGDRTSVELYKAICEQCERFHDPEKILQVKP